jgi:SAM-dependent methyltransferase
LAAAIEDVFVGVRRRPLRPGAASRPPLPLEITIPALSCGPAARRAWRDLRARGWAIDARPLPLDQQRREWGDSACVRLTISATTWLDDALGQLCQALWSLALDAVVEPDGNGARCECSDTARVRRLSGLDEHLGGDLDPADRSDGELGHATAHATDDWTAPVRWAPLRRQRIDAVAAALDEVGAHSVVDLGCGSGDLLVALVARPRLARIVGLDVSVPSLRRAAQRLGHRLGGPPPAIGRVELIQGSLTYADPRLSGLDAAVLMEVIEHIDAARLPVVEQHLFGEARPGAVLVTTPDADYNVNYEEFSGSRHPDHRFEWTGAEFSAWCGHVADRHRYTYSRRTIGKRGPNGATPTQLAVFIRAA